MSTNSVNMDAGTVSNNSLVLAGISLGSFSMAPWPMTRVIRIATVYSVTKVSTRTQNMLCIASMTPRAKRYNGRTALTSRSSRKIRKSRSIRTSNKISSNWSLRCCPATIDIHRVRSHWSHTPKTTMTKSNMFHRRPSPMKNWHPCRRKRTASSNTKKPSMQLSRYSHKGDLTSVSTPMTTMLATITTETSELNHMEPVHRKSERSSTPRSFTARSNRSTRKARSAGTQVSAPKSV
mmetsp:Transcript_12470/g.37075  ORF Transcript_12470/g.37075 Transcript_12470/m.37075 type:complete len:236 (-) Transcript_12470:443-1150(-)